MRRARDAAPDFTLGTVGGAARSLRQILAGGPVLLAFFKVSCPVCQFTFPFLERLFRGQGLQVIGISQDEAPATAEYHRRFGITFPSLLDPARDNYPVSNAFGISHVPTLFLVEPDGAIALASEGFSRRDIAALGERAGVAVFGSAENIPEFKPG